MENTPTTLDYSKAEIVATLKQTVAQGLNDAEFRLFVEHCRGTGLNPFKKEVWAIKAGGRLQVMTGINGFLAIANGHPQFDGMEVEVDSDEAPTKATCKVWRKDRKFPAVGVAMLKEYGKETPIWRQMPRVMLTKVAKSIAIREAFPQELNGLYTEEEMPREFELPRNGSAAQARMAGEGVAAHPTVFIAEPPKVDEAAQAPVSSTVFQYDLGGLDPEKLPAAVKMLKAVGAVTEDENMMLWESPKQLTKLQRYEVAA